MSTHELSDQPSASPDEVTPEFVATWSSPLPPVPEDIRSKEGMGNRHWESFPPSFSVPWPREEEIKDHQRAAAPGLIGPLTLDQLILQQPFDTDFYE